jgi:hypothetical protein
MRIRALLTDIFLIDVILKSSKAETSHGVTETRS